MGWFRSAEMAYVSFQFNKDAAHRSVERLGELGTVQFVDLNAGTIAFNRRFIEPIRRCDELERKLRFFADEMASKGIVPRQHSAADFVPLGSIDRLQQLDSMLSERETDLQSWLSSLQQLRAEWTRQREQLEVLRFGREFMSWSGAVGDLEGGIGGGGPGAARSSRTGSDPNQHVAPLLEEPHALIGGSGSASDEGLVQRIGGVVASAVKDKFSRMLFRVSRGNALVLFSEVDAGASASGDRPAAPSVSASASDAEADMAAKHAFIIVVSSDVLARKARKVMAAFDASSYELPADVDEIVRRTREGRQTLHEQEGLLSKNEAACTQALMALAAEHHGWRCAVRKEKAIYHTLNMFRADAHSSRFSAEGWVISESLPDVRRAVLDAHGELPAVVDQLLGAVPDAPTHFELNKFTAPFQELVNTYGVPRYREINPALFTAVTFPFLFGVMYGDVGHGSCLLLFGLYLVLTEGSRSGRKLGEFVGGLHFARYMILLMGVFAVYCGFVYNDCFSLGLDVMPGGSRWSYVYGDVTHYDEVANATGRPALPTGSLSADGHYVCANGTAHAACPAGGNVYPFGLDPVWHTASNELLMTNSLKMKLSVILGVAQMTFGICLKGANAWHAGSRVDFFFDFVPQLMFACALFVYMVVMILIKWSINWDYRMSLVTPGHSCPADLGGCQPPSLITTLINIVLKPGAVAEPMYAGQAGTQTTLLLLCMLSVPVMLLGKPLFLRWLNSRNPRTLLDGDGEHADHGGGGGGGHGHGGPFNFAELMIHQGIETIEFVLGMVSNTASYLRLWALSLAHTELAGVFWNKVMVMAISTHNPFLVFIAFAIFAGITTAVLLMMDVLECFLHALRLHWVEFQNKFYAADGTKFHPLNFETLTKEL
eukprot:g4908.t1